MIELPGLAAAAEDKPEEKYDFYVQLSVTLNVGIVIVNVFPVYVVCKAKSGKRQTAVDEIVLSLAVTSILSVLVPGGFQLTAFYNRSWYEKQTICHFYQVSVGCLYLVYAWLVTFASCARMHVTSYRNVEATSSSGCLATARVRIVVAVIYACSVGISCIPLFGLADDEPISNQRCQFWLFRSSTKQAKDSVYFIVFVVIVAASLLTGVGGVVCVLHSVWNSRRGPRFKQMERMASVCNQTEEKVVAEWAKIIVLTTAVLVLSWTFGLVVLVLLRLGFVWPETAAKYALLCTSLSNLVNPIICGVLSAKYRQGYRQVFINTSRFLFGCPIQRQELSDGTEDAEGDTTIRPYLGGYSFSAVCAPSGGGQPSSCLPVANIDALEDGTIGGAGEVAIANGMSLALRNYLLEFDPSRGHSSVNPCDYDAIDMKVRSYADGTGEWKGTDCESGISLLTDGSDDGNVSEDTEIENIE